MLVQLAARAGVAADDAAEIGRDQGRIDGVAPRARGLDCVSALLDRLAVLGFDPEPVEDAIGTTVAFAHCPFADLARENPEVVCHLHRGLVEGLADAFEDHDVAAFRTFTDRNRARSISSRWQYHDGSASRRIDTVITLTDTAASKVAELLEQEDDAALALRVAVRPGGCSGFSYEMFFDTETAADDLSLRLRRRAGRVRPHERPAPGRRHAGLQGRSHGHRVRHRQPERPAHLRVRPVLQLIPALPARPRRR